MRRDQPPDPSIRPRVRQPANAAPQAPVQERRSHRQSRQRDSAISRMTSQLPPGSHSSSDGTWSLSALA